MKAYCIDCKWLDKYIAPDNGEVLSNLCFCEEPSNLILGDGISKNSKGYKCKPTIKNQNNDCECFEQGIYKPIKQKKKWWQ